MSVYFWHGHVATAMEFVTGYVIELSLSVDNLFIFLLIFRYFRVPAEHQHKVLFWGIVGALVMRGYLHCGRHWTDPKISLDHIHFRRAFGVQRHQAVPTDMTLESSRKTIRCCGCSAVGCR